MPLNTLDRLAIIVPALDPDVTLVTLIDQLIALGFSNLIVVNDGSQPAAREIFETLVSRRGVEVLHHAVNCGKGRALKTAFNHCLCHHPSLLGVVTADADGQHTPHDIVRIARELLSSDEVCLGVRQFTGQVPLRSRLGNSFTRGIFNFLYGGGVQDTQTGLRALPRSVLPQLVTLAGERYEYETGMLIELITSKRSLRQVPIQTIYIDGNRASHFNPLLDSMRIYFIFLRFFASSLLAAGVDLAAFAITIAMGGPLMLALVVGRTTAIGINFLVNSRFVFKKVGEPRVLFRYLVVVVVLMAMSYLLIRELQIYTSASPVLAKVIAESGLFLISFAMQRAFVFGKWKRSHAV